MSNRSDLEIQAAQNRRDHRRTQQRNGQAAQRQAARHQENLEEARFHLVQEWSETWTRLGKTPCQGGVGALMSEELETALEQQDLTHRGRHCRNSSPKHKSEKLLCAARKSEGGVGYDFRLRCSAERYSELGERRAKLVREWCDLKGKLDLLRKPE